MPRKALEIARSHGVIALSDAVYGEIAEVLGRPKFARALPDDRRREILELLTAAPIWIELLEPVDDCRDAKDNRYLAMALAAHATAIVSGDEDLLVLNPCLGAQVLRPAQFVGLFTPGGTPRLVAVQDAMRLRVATQGAAART
jgi:putative PIN family toxin of toxin-antitoxin system